MPDTAAEVAEEAKNVYLNRMGVSDTKILPVISAEYKTLQQILHEHDVPILNKVFDPITVGLGVTILTSDATLAATASADLLPTDFVEPFKLYERAVGQLDSDFIPMRERRFLPIATISNELTYWSWIGDEIRFLGANSAREVRILGLRALEGLESLLDPINIPFSTQYLSAATAATCAVTIMQNPSMGDRIRIIANTKLDKLLSRYDRKNQSLPVRREGMRRERGLRWR